MSVVVPVFNGERFLAETLRSVVAQDYHPLEIIVVDDGSSDGSRSVAASFPEVTLLSQANGGAAAARNAGVAASHGAIISFLDADDLWLPGKASMEMRHFAGHSETGYTLCSLRYFLEPGKTPPPWLKPKHLDRCLCHSPCAMAVRRAVFDQVGGFNVNCVQGEDIDWFMRASDAGVRVAAMDEVFVRIRVHSTSLTTNKKQARQAILDVARLALARRKAREREENPPCE